MDNSCAVGYMAQACTSPEVAFRWGGLWHLLSIHYTLIYYTKFGSLKLFPFDISKASRAKYFTDRTHWQQYLPLLPQTVWLFLMFVCFDRSGLTLFGICSEGKDCLVMGEPLSADGPPVWTRPHPTVATHPVPAALGAMPK